MFAFGVITKKLYKTAQAQLALRSAGSMVLLVFLLRFNIFGLTSDLGTGIVKASLDAVPLAMFLAVGESAARRRSSSSRG